MDTGLNSIILKNPIFKMFKEELDKMLQAISLNYNIPYDEVSQIAFNNSNIALQYGIRKRTKRKIEASKQCMGRKIDGEQCTRSKKGPHEYCLSHHKNLKFGRIDDEKFNNMNQTKISQNKKKSDEYLATKRLVVNNVTYLIDDKQNIYTYNVESPVLIGKYQINHKSIISKH